MHAAWGPCLPRLSACVEQWLICAGDGGRMTLIIEGSAKAVDLPSTLAKKSTTQPRLPGQPVPKHKDATTTEDAADKATAFTDVAAAEAAPTHKSHAHSSGGCCPPVATHSTVPPVPPTAARQASACVAHPIAVYSPLPQPSSTAQRAPAAKTSPVAPSSSPPSAARAPGCHVLLSDRVDPVGAAKNLQIVPSRSRHTPADTSASGSSSGQTSDSRNGTPTDAMRSPLSPPSRQSSPPTQSPLRRGRDGRRSPMRSTSSRGISAAAEESPLSDYIDGVGERRVSTYTSARGRGRWVPSHVTMQHRGPPPYGRSWGYRGGRQGPGRGRGAVGESFFGRGVSFARTMPGYDAAPPRAEVWVSDKKRKQELEQQGRGPAGAQQR
jgi:hypothetical protein